MDLLANPAAALFVYLVFLLVFAAVGAGLGAWVAGQKGRSYTEGALLGFFFSAFGVIIEALLPSKGDNLR